MFSYAAVDAAELTGIYECPPNENAEEWLKVGPPTVDLLGKQFPNYLFEHFNYEVHFTSKDRLKIGKQYIVCHLEGSNGAKEIHEEIFSDSLKEVYALIESHVRKLTHVHDFQYETKVVEGWLDDFEVNGWVFDITCVVAHVKHDPRINPWQVKFASYGFRYDIIVDPVESKFNDLYENHILPTLEDMASQEQAVLMEHDEIKRQLLPEMVKDVIFSAGQVNFQDFDPAKLMSLIEKKFSGFTL